MIGLLASLVLAAIPHGRVAHAAVAPPIRDDSLRQRIEARIAAVPGASVGVAFRDLGAADALYINADTLFHAASTMKVPVMIELFRQIDQGALSLDRDILLVNQFGSIVDGSPYSLDAGEDSDSSLYALVGTRVSVRELVRRMIDRSSNLATNALIALVSAERAQATARALGAPTILVRRGVEDQKAYDAGLNNKTSARDLAAVMEAIERGRAASSASCAAMREILLGQEFNERIPAGLPPGTRVAHKTGEITAIAHDAAIVYPDGRAPYVLIVLTGGIRDQRVANALAADISRIVYEYAMKTRALGALPRDQHQ